MTTAAAPARLPSRLVALPVVAAVAAAGLLAATAALGPDLERTADETGTVQAARTDALAAASSGVATVLSYDYRHLSKDFAKAEALMTPAFRKKYEETTAKAVEPLAQQVKATSTAEISAAAVSQAEPTRAVVLLFVNQTSTNSTRAEPRLDQARLAATMVKSGDRWLIDNLDTL